MSIQPLKVYVTLNKKGLVNVHLVGIDESGQFVHGHARDVSQVDSNTIVPDLLAVMEESFTEGQKEDKS